MLHLFNVFKAVAFVSVPFLANLPAVHTSFLSTADSLTLTYLFPRLFLCIS